MKILGLETLVFAVDDIEACVQCALDYGLKPASGASKESGGRYEALDGTGIEIRAANTVGLPAAPDPSMSIRETVYGVADQACLEAIAAELAKDREVTRDAQGGVHSVDDTGYAIGFALTVRRQIDTGAVLCNAPGSVQSRGVNEVATDMQMTADPLSMSHVVFFVPDVKKAEAFYVNRLGFRVTDRFVEVGPFLRPAGSNEHHCLFLIETPTKNKGMDHFTFHMRSPTEMMLAGTRFEAKGYKSYWGPGRHLLGSNWFWYFVSPFGCKVEYDADMDLHDDSWVPREVEPGADNSQLFLFTSREKWAPGGPPGGQPH
jgi:catechol 2,3-dioxygenase-like lactoylglutathione lyase family enzyme